MPRYLAFPLRWRYDFRFIDSIFLFRYGYLPDLLVLSQHRGSGGTTTWWKRTLLSIMVTPTTTGCMIPIKTVPSGLFWEIIVGWIIFTSGEILNFNWNVNHKFNNFIKINNKLKMAIFHLLQLQLSGHEFLSSENIKSLAWILHKICVSLIYFSKRHKSRDKEPTQ